MDLPVIPVGNSTSTSTRRWGDDEDAVRRDIAGCCVRRQRHGWGWRRSRRPGWRWTGSRRTPTSTCAACRARCCPFRLQHPRTGALDSRTRGSGWPESRHFRANPRGMEVNVEGLQWRSYFGPVGAVAPTDAKKCDNDGLSTSSFIII